MERNLLTCDQASEILRRRGISPTRQRLEIARVLLSHRTHCSADQVLAKVCSVGAEVSKATVYNTLRLFVGAGLLREVVVDPNRVFYDSNVSQHHHLYDVVSGELIDIPVEHLSVIGIPPLPEGMIEDGIDVIIRIRPSC